MSAILPQLHQAKPIWIFAGILLTFFYTFLQGLMYVVSFRAVGVELKLKDSIELFLKRKYIFEDIFAGTSPIRL